MPWKTESPMEQKQRFVLLDRSGHFTIRELCEEFEISRKSGHKSFKRDEAEASLGSLLFVRGLQSSLFQFNLDLS